MAYQVSNVATLAAIIPIVATFAASNGWTVGGTPSIPTFRRADDATALTFTLGTMSNAGTGDYSLVMTENSGIGNSAATFQPKLNGAALPDLQPPTKVHLFAAATPQPFCAIVIEFGFNNYRHLYLGNMEKLGSYGGGEIVAGQQAAFAFNNFSFPLSFTGGRFMFQGRGNWGTKAQSGGVRVVHANNPNTWRSFYDPSNNPIIQASVDSALGGFNDRINDPFVFRGRNSFAGAQMLVPINLYAPLEIVGDRRFTPIGKPSGIRLVNMIDLEPGARIQIGVQFWRVFPATRKSENTSSPQGSGGTYGAYDTSFAVGYAYPEN